MKKRIRTLLSVTAVLLALSGCSTTSGLGSSSGGPRGLKYDFWTSYSKEETLTPGYGMYTYLLMRETTSTGLLKINLIEEILSQSEGIAVDSQSDKEEFNLFIFPTKELRKFFNDGYDKARKKEKVDYIIEKYSDNFAKDIIRYLAENSDHEGIRKKLSDTENGPFLVSLMKPLDLNRNKETAVILLDATKLNPNIVPHVIKRYRKYIYSHDINEDKVLRDFSIYLGNMLVDANEALFVFKIFFSS